MSKTVQKEKNTKILLYQKNGKKKKEHSGCRALSAFFSYAVFLVLSCSYLLIYESVFELDGAGWVYFFGAALFCFVSFLLYLKEYLDWKAHLMTVGMMLVWYLIFHQRILAGCLMQWNELLEKAGIYYGIYLSPIPIQNTAGSSQMAVLFLMALLIWWSGAGFFYRKSAFRTFLPAGMLCILDLMLGKAPDTSAVFLLAVGVAGCLPFCSGRRLEGRREVKTVQARAGVVLLCTMAVFLLFASRIGEEKAAELVGRHDEMLSYQRNTEEWIKSGSFFSVFQRESGKISNRAPEYDDTVVMNVILDQKPDGLYYLRGYVGDTYQNGSWSNTGAKAFEDYVGTEGVKEENGKSILNFLYQTVEAAGNRELEKMQIQYLKTGNNYAYLPYGADLSSLKSGPDTEIRYSGDAMILKDGTDSLMMQGYLTGMDWGSNGDFVGNAENRKDSAAAESYEDFLGRYLEVPQGLRQIHALGQELLQELEDYRSDFGQYSRNEIAGYLVKKAIAERTTYSLDLDSVPVRQDITQYFLFGSGKGFCQHYASAGVLLLRELGVPARYVTGYAVSEQEFFEQADGSYLAAVKDRDAHAWVEYYADGVGWIPVEMTEGINEQADQYSIPKTEADLLPVADETGEAGKNDTVQSESQTEETVEQDVQNRDEDQQEDILKDTKENSADQTNPQEQMDEIDKKNPAENGTEAAGERSGASENQKENAAKDHRRIILLLIVAGAVVLLTGVIYRVTAERKKRRWREFHQKNCRKAVKSISFQTYRLLQKRGYLKGQKPESDREYYKVFLELSGEKENQDGQDDSSFNQMISMEESDRYFEILRRAFYSKEEITGEDAAFCRSIYKKVRHITENGNF